MQNKPYLLIVDCDADLTDALCPVLLEHGFECRVASDGGEALAEMRRRKPDLVIFDRALRRMSGDEFARRLAADRAFAEIPLIVVTATDLAENALIGFTIDPQNYLCKPFSLTVLLERIHASLGACVAG